MGIAMVSEAGYRGLYTPKLSDSDVSPENKKASV